MIKNICIILVVSLSVCFLGACTGMQSGTQQSEGLQSDNITDKIRADQLGYRRIGVKQAVVVDVNADTFVVVKVENGEEVFAGQLSAPVTAANAGETVRIADFSALEDQGEYFIRTAIGRSHPFIISDEPYGDLRLAVLEMFNYQVCGIALDKGRWTHPACHLRPATIHGTRITKDVTGGWHDAGDYGRYVVPAAKSIADLLLAYETGKVQDEALLDIVWYKIEWMLKMQDPDSGGVYHKVTTRSFPALNLWPHRDGAEVISPISPTATADFAASMALASRFYPQHRNMLLDAAKLAWDWCLKNPNAPNFTNPPGIVTGEYGDRSDRDERYWAATELFIATKDEAYHNFLKQNASWISTGFGWQAMGSYALTAYIFNAGNVADADLMVRMRNRFLSECENIMNRFKNSPYGESMGNSFPWGSNMYVANNAIMLILGAKLVERPDYIEAASQHLNYLLGFNSLGKSFITGYGPTGARNPHHRLSIAANATVPGMVVGGPEEHLSDPVLRQHFSVARTPAAKRYIDHRDSYASNEITIYWNSPVYCLMALLGV